MTTWTTRLGDRVEIYETAENDHREFRWRVRATNGEIVGSGEGHTRKAAAIAAAERHHPRIGGDEG